MTRSYELDGEHLEFWREKHHCTVTSLKQDGSPHVVPMGIVVDPAGSVVPAAEIRITNLGTAATQNTTTDSAGFFRVTNIFAGSYSVTVTAKGAALLDVVHAPTLVKYPMVRAPGSNEFNRISWDDALDRIARLMKEDRDKNFIAKNAAGTTVNRWTSTGMLAASATSNETAFLTWKVARSFGMGGFDNQARV